MNTVITISVHLYTLIGIVLIGGIVFGMVAAVLFRYRKTLYALINEKL